jgi:hypothetical protein
VIAAEFTGGWQRASMSLDGAPPFEDMVVWWLQSSTKHADLRVPLTPVGDCICFAGTTVWEPPSLTWIPDLELVPNEFPDTGMVTWDGEDLLEAGTFVIDGAEVGYVERWRRLPDAAGPLLALSKPAGRIVCTGSLALTVVDERPLGGEFKAVAWRLMNEAWTLNHCWPADATAARPPAPAQLTTGMTVSLDDGELWTVDEATNPMERMASHHG